VKVYLVHISIPFQGFPSHPCQDEQMLQAESGNVLLSSASAYTFSAASAPATRTTVTDASSSSSRSSRDEGFFDQEVDPEYQDFFNAVFGMQVLIRNNIINVLLTKCY